MGRRATDRFFKRPPMAKATVAAPATEKPAEVVSGAETQLAAAAEPAVEPVKLTQPNPRGKTLLFRIKELLNEKSLKADGRLNTRFDDVANAFVSAMESGSFIHTKEFIDRQEGKVPNRIADPDGKPLKLYVGMPVDDNDPNAP